MRDILLKKTQNPLNQFIRYAFVGGFAAVIDTASLYVMNVRLGVHHLIAAAISFVLGLIVNYLISIAWVFETAGNVTKEFTLFAVIGIGGLAWTELILWLGVDRLHGSTMPVKIVALFLVLIWNFGMRKAFVFNSQ